MAQILSLSLFSLPPFHCVAFDYFPLPSAPPPHLFFPSFHFLCLSLWIRFLVSFPHYLVFFPSSFFFFSKFVLPPSSLFSLLIHLAHSSPLLRKPRQLPSWYWLSPHIFIRILLFTLLDSAPGQWSNGALERRMLGLHVSSSHVSLLADLPLLICLFQVAESALQGCSYLTPPVLGFTVMKICHRQTGVEDLI